MAESAPKASPTKPVKPYEHKKSRELFARAAAVIPCGIYGHLSPAPLVPPSAYPFFAGKADGSRFWDVDGNEYIDYMCAYGPMVLGYGHPKVEAAARAAQEAGSCMTCPSPDMVELAELLVDTVSMADWAFFAKNGNDVTTQALMVARAATCRDKVLAVSGGYHGAAPWTQAPGHHGVCDADVENIIRVPWNDFAAFERAVYDHPDEIAAFIASPYHHPVFMDNAYPAEGYWDKVCALCRQKGIVVIVDDIRCGFRLDVRGSHEYFGFTPDLVCFCKAIGNGHPISALVGTDALKNDAARVFYTGSYWFSGAPMAAAAACIRELVEIDGPRKMMDFGMKLTKGLKDLAASFGYDLAVTGAPSMPYLRITNDESMMLHQDWCGEVTRRGAFFS
ncbi:MAG: aminotransferase class III-fold pyridoxal phosphate-dependent enzyme, partial [Deltaproteobacteria bacterium]|nr:aminotransferase class III-fold pyridoxal phosphate-dependent enzyme [Deltaproteobacteria bacterium]